MRVSYDVRPGGTGLCFRGRGLVRGIGRKRTEVESITGEIEPDVVITINTTKAQRVTRLGLVAGLLADVQAHRKPSGTPERGQPGVITQLDKARLVNGVVDLETDLGRYMSQR